MSLLYWKIFLGQSEEPKLQHRCLMIIVLVSLSLSRNFLSNVFFLPPLFHGGLTSLYLVGGSASWPFTWTSLKFGWFGREHWMWRWWVLLQEGTSYFHLLRLTSFLSDCLRGFEFGPWSPEEGVLLGLLEQTIPYLVLGCWLSHLDWAQTN